LHNVETELKAEVIPDRQFVKRESEFNLLIAQERPSKLEFPAKKVAHVTDSTLYGVGVSLYPGGSGLTVSGVIGMPLL